MANGDPWPQYYHGVPCQAPQHYATAQTPGLGGQLGDDPISKLADAINNLADALRTRDAPES